MSEDGQCCGGECEQPDADPGNSEPEAWSEDHSDADEAEQERLIVCLIAEVPQ